MTTEVRPWGIFENLLEEIDYKVKRIIITPNHSISLQYHFHREEYWIVVEGDGELILEDTTKHVEVGDSVFIKKEELHRLKAGKNGITIIETQLGVCDEEDIVRLEDHYGRVE
jgi:mannose-6-phosphate isomerase-like protein (cupin superfamily)